MATLPITGSVEFRPNSAAVKAAREAMDKAQTAVNEAEAAIDAAKVAHEASPDDEALAKASLDAIAKGNSANLALSEAQKALDKAEAALAKDDPTFTLIVPTARTTALVEYDMDMDPELPARPSLKDAAGGLLAEAKETGVSEDGIAIIERAVALAEAGENVTGTDWDDLAKVASKLYSWRALMAPYKLFSSLEASYRIRRHLALHSSRKVLAEADLAAPEVKPYLAAINAELLRLSTVSADQAKN